MSSLASRNTAIYAVTGVNFSAAQGCLVTVNNGVVALNLSATVPAAAVVLMAM